MKGVIVDKTGFPLPGANVMEKGTSNGTITDLDGNFSLNVSKKGVTLTVSFMGYTPKDVVVKDKTMNITLEENSKLLDEVVVVGYGTMKKRDVTGAITSISSEAIEQKMATNVFEALQGTTAAENPYKFKKKTFKPDTNPLLIYECHIGMAQQEEKVGTYNEFREKILPRIAEEGYNCIQIMAIQEHPYYGSFGYHVSSFFAASSRFGTPDELKALIDAAHEMGIAVIMDIVHSHAVKNEVEGLGNFAGLCSVLIKSPMNGLAKERKSVNSKLIYVKMINGCL